MPNRRITDGLLQKLFYVVFFIISTQAVAQCPTISDPIQSFCATPNPLMPTLRPRVSDLVATDQGGGVFWYTTLTGGTALPGSVNLDDGVTYFADDGTQSCVVRQSVTVNIFGEPPTNHDRFVGRCSSEINTIDQLDADGTNIEWFDAQTGGNLLPGSTPLVTGTEYWVQQTENGCTSRRLPTLVTIIDPGPPTGPDEQFFCFDAANPVVFEVSNLSASGTEIRWYNSPTSTFPLDPSTPLVNNATYYATQTTFPCESTERLATIVRIDNLPDPGMDGTLNICDSSTASINLFSQLNGSPETTGTWSGPLTTTGGHLGRVDTSLMNPGPFVFTYTIAPVNACPEVSATVTVNVQEEPDAGQDNVLEICTNEPTVDLFTLLGGSPDAGGTWSPALTSGTGVFDPFVDPSGVYTYVVSPTAPCTLNDTATITVTVTQAPFAGPDVPASLCASDPAVDLFSLLTGADPGGVWSPALASGTGIFDPAVDTAGAYTYSLAPSATCPADESIVTVSIIAAPEAGDDNSIELCSNDSPVDLFTVIGGAPDAGGSWSPALTSATGIFDPAVDTAGVYTYTVNPTAPCTSPDTSRITVDVEQAPDPGTNGSDTLCTSEAPINLFTLLGGTPDTGGTWTPTLASGTGIFDPSVDAAGTYTYTIAETAVCASVASAVTITLTTQPFAGDNGSIDLCTNNATVDLFSVLGGSPDAGGTWSPALASGTGVFNPAVDTGGSYTYTLAALGVCPGDNATVTVNLSTAPVIGTNATITVCADDATFDLFPLLGTGVDTNGTWSGPSTVTNGNTGTFDPSTNTSGAYVYTILGTGACDDSSATVTVTVVDPAPTLQVDGQIFCIADSPLVSDLINNIVPDVNGTIQVYSSATGNVALGGTDALVNGDTYYVTETDLVSGCESTNRLIVTVQINDPQPPVLSTASAEFCFIDSPVISDLNSFVDLGSNVIWFDAPTNGNQFSDSDTLVAGSYYAVEEDVNGCQSPASTEISVIINNNAPPTLNEGGNGLCGVEMPTLAELEANLTTDAGLAIVWYDTLDSTTALNITDLLLDNTTYYAATFNAVTGCESNERLEIEVDLTDCDLDQYPLLLPDGFSPNGDGINDTYSLENVQFLYEDFTIEIYNRYGNLLYMGNNSTPPWDGTSNQPGALGDNVVPNGVYFYIFNYNRANVPPVQGRIYLNR